MMVGHWWWLAQDRATTRSAVGWWYTACTVGAKIVGAARRRIARAFSEWNAKPIFWQIWMLQCLSESPVKADLALAISEKTLHAAGRHAPPSA